MLYPSSRGVRSIAFFVFASCSNHVEERATKELRPGVFATWKESLPAGQVIEVGEDHFRYREYCDPDPDEKPTLPYPVEGTIQFDGDVVVFCGPNGWRISRHRVQVYGIDILLRNDAYEAWIRDGVMVNLGVAARVEGATFDNVDSRRRSMHDVAAEGGSRNGAR